MTYSLVRLDKLWNNYTCAEAVADKGLNNLSAIHMHGTITGLPQNTYWEALHTIQNMPYSDKHYWVIRDDNNRSLSDIVRNSNRKDA